MTPEHKKRLAEGIYERRRASLSKMRGFFAGLDDAQKQEALAYRGEENLGDAKNDTGSVT